MALSKSNLNDFISLVKEGIFKVPDYQRRYSWQRKHATELWQDLQIAYKEKTPHFFGTLSLQHVKKDSGGLDNCYDIIDGQQRFTTLVLLCHFLAERGKHKEYLDLTRKGEGHFFSPINESENSFFKSILDNGSGKAKTISQENMAGISKDYRNAVAKLSPKNAYDHLVFILNNANFMINLVEDELSAIRMFEIINDRGCPISYFDKIKSIFVYHAHKIDQEMVNKIKKLFDNIYSYFDYKEFTAFGDKNNDDTLLLHHYLSNPTLFTNMHWNYTQSVRDIYGEMKVSIVGMTDKEKMLFIGQYLEDIKHFIDAVHRIEQKIKKDKRYDDFFSFFGS